MRASNPTAYVVCGRAANSFRAARLALGALLMLVASLAQAQANFTTSTFSGPANYTPGSTSPSTYTLTINNTGTASDTATLTTTFESGANIGSWSCTATGATSSCGANDGTGNLAGEVVTVHNGGNVVITFANVTFQSSTPHATFDATASIDPNGAINAFDRTAQSTRVLNSDISIGKTAALSTYAPLGTNSYTLTVTNGGPSDATGVVIADSAPVGLTYGAWTCVRSDAAACNDAGGNGNFSESENIPSGLTLTYGIAVTYQAGATGATIVDAATATLADPPDGNQTNNSASVTLTRDPSADFAVAFTPNGGALTYIPGSTGNALTLTVTNNGSATASAPLSLDFPAIVAATWSCAVCSPNGPSGDINTTVTLGPGASVNIPIFMAFDSGALTASLPLTARIDVDGAPGPDPASDPADRSVTNTYAIDRRADIVLDKSGPTTASPAQSFVYLLQVDNDGPSDVGNGSGETGIVVTDDLDSRLRGDPVRCAANPEVPCWSYCPYDDNTIGNYTPSTCPVAAITGSGDLVGANRPAIRLRNGSRSTVEIYVAVPNNLTNGTIANSASIALGTSSPLQTETNATNNADSTSTDVAISTDIVVTKTDDPATAVAGGVHSYTVTVRNNGFNTASGVDVSDVLPLFAGSGAGFVPNSISWQCRAFDGGCCAHNGASQSCGLVTPTTPVTANVLTSSVDLPSQARVEYTVTGTLDARSSGTLSNTASATPPAGLVDADPSNNSATDTSTIVATAGLSLQKRLLSISPDGPPFALEFEIVVANAGPSRAVDAQVTDLLNLGQLDAAVADWTCSVIDNPSATQCDAASGTGPLQTTVDLDAGGRVRFVLSVPTTADADGQITNTASVTSGTVTVSSTVVTNLAATGDLGVSKTGPAAAIPGTPVEYLIRVTNAGPDDAFGTLLEDRIAPQLENATWSCAATTPVPGDLAFLGIYGGENGGRALALSDDGRHVYAVSPLGNSVSAYDRNTVPGLNFGALAALETEIDGSNDAQDTGGTVSGLHHPIDAALSADGALLYVLSAAEDNASGPDFVAAIAVFGRVTNPVDPAYGKLSFVGSLATDLPSTSVARIAVTNTSVYVTGVGGSTPMVAVFRRSPSNGMPIHDVNTTANVPSDPRAIAVSVSDQAVFVASADSGAIARYRIEPASGPTPAGRLTHVVSLTDPDLAGVTDLAIAAGDDHLYAAAGTSARIGALHYDGNGLVASQRYSATDLGAIGTDPLGGDGVRLALAPDGEHLLVTNRGAGTTHSPVLLQLRRDAQTGLLDYEDGFVDGPGIAGTEDIAITADGRHVVMANGNAGVGTRQLTAYSRRAPDPRFGFLEMDREGDALDDGSGNTLVGLQSPADVVTSPDGEHVYAVSLAEGALVAFRRDPRSGADGDSSGAHLTPIASYVDGVGSIAGIKRATRVQISPDGELVFVTSEDFNTLATFARNTDAQSPDFGKLVPQQVLTDGGAIDGLLGAQGIAVDETSTHVYVAGSFESAIAMFHRVGNQLEYLGVMKAGSGGLIGMNGMRDLVVSGDGRHVLGVSSLSNAVVVFNRNGNQTDTNYGRLTFLQARTVTGVNLKSIAIPSTRIDPTDNEHVYVVGQDDNSIIVLKRVVDPASTAFGTLSTLFEYRGTGGVSGPRDVAISPDGRQVYVGSQFGNSIQLFERDRNRSSMNYGSLSLVESRGDGADGVDGLANLYALAVSGDSRNVYVAGFGDRAVASFAIGSGSFCSAAGSGNIEDEVNIGAGGTLEYRITAMVRPDATGTLCNTATVDPPDRFEDSNAANDSSTTCATLTPQADLSISKTNERVSVVAGETVSYEVRVANPGPSNLVHDAGNPLTVSDLLDSNPSFVPGSAQWTCAASDSGTLDFVAASFDGTPGIDRLGGVTDLALAADSDGTGPLPAFLAAASVLDDSLTVFSRDPGDGTLSVRATAFEGGVLEGVAMNSLAGARAVVASADGRHLYLASRISDAVTAFAIEDVGSGQLRLRRIDVQRNRVGLDQATHLALSPDQRFLYVAGANDDAIAVFRRDLTTGVLTWVESEQNGVDDAGDGGGIVVGLDGVEFLLPSPDGEHLYALSGAGGSIARFDRDSVTGRLTWRNVRDADDLGAGLDGAGAAVFDATGEHLYVSAAGANRVLALNRVNQPAAGNFGDLLPGTSVTEGVGDSRGLLSPRRVALSGDGAHLYVAAQGGSSVAWYSRDPADGSLRFLGLRSIDSGGVEGMQGATGLALDDGLDQVYVAGTLQSALVQFTRQADSSCPSSGSGELNQIPVNIAAGGSVTFRIDVQVASTVSTDVTNVASVNSAADPNPGNNEASDSDGLAVVADLSITKDDGLAEYDGLAGARALAATATDLYVAGAADNAIGHLRRDAVASSPSFGALRFADVVRSGVGGVLGLNAVSDLVLSGDGAHLYATSPSDNSVAVFARDATDGDLAYLELQRNGVLGVAGMSGARALTLSGDGRSVYVVAEFSKAVVAFSRQTAAGPGFGRLTFQAAYQQGVGGIDGMEAPAAVAVSPDGEHVYVLSGSAMTLAVFRRNSNVNSGTLGQLSFVRRYAGSAGSGSGLEAGRSLAFAGNAHLYVLGAAPGTLAHFVRTPASGELALGAVLQQGRDGITDLAGARRIRVAPGGAQLYVAGGDNDSLTHYDIATDGVLTAAGRIGNGDVVAGGGQVVGLDGASDVAIDADGVHLYATAFDDGALSGFDRIAIAPDLGDLAYRETLFDGLGGVAPGESVRYRIEVANAGPASVPQARVRDIFPPQFVSASWSCVDQINGGLCVASGTGNIDTLVALPPNSRVVFEAVGVLGDAVGGTLVNTATVQAVGGADPDPNNNAATDGNTVLSPALDLVAGFTAVNSSDEPGSPIQYEIEIQNLGPTYADDAVVSDRLPEALLDVSWTCAAYPVAGLLTQVQELVEPDGATDAIITAVVPNVLGQFVYASAQLDGVGAVLVYRRDPLDGTLDLVQTVRNGSNGVGGLDGAADLVLSSDGRFVYVAGSSADAIVLFARDAADGTLSYVTRYQDGDVEGLGGVRRLLFAPGGAHLYAAGAIDDAVTVLAVNPGDGRLTRVSGVRQEPGTNGLDGALDLAWSPGATHLFVLARENQSLSVFARNAGSGALTRTLTLEEFQLGSGALLDPSALEVDGNRLMVASASNGRISSFVFDAAATPTPTLSAGAAAISGVPMPRDLSFDPDQARLYVAATGASELQVYSLLGATPELLAQYPAAQVRSLARSPDARQLYAGGASTITFARERGSRCAALGGSGAIGQQTVDIAPGGRLEYAVGGDIFPNATGNLVYEVEAQPRTLGVELEPADNIARDERALRAAPVLSASKTDNLTSVVAGTAVNYQLGFDNSGISAAVGARVLDQAPVFPSETAGLLAGSGSWSCAVDPALAAQETRDLVTDPALQGVGRMVTSPDGARVYAVSAARDALLVLARLPDGSLGALQEIRDGSTLGTATVQGLDGASAVRVSADGGTVLVTGAAANSLVVFHYDAVAGTHRFVQKLTSGSDGIVGMTAPEDVVFAEGDRAVYVAAPATDSIAVFSRDAETGMLAFVERVRDGFGTISPDSDVLRGVRRLHASGDGRNLYALASNSHAVSSFAIDPATSKLTYLGVLRRGTVAGLDGARELAVAPGDKQLYVLGSAAIVRLMRQGDGRLAAIDSVSDAPGLVQPRALALDRSGSRLYLVDAGGGISIFARDWASGALAFRHRVDAVTPVPTGPAAVLHAASGADLFVSVAEPGRLRRYDERPLSFCHASSGTGELIDRNLDLDVGGHADLVFDATVHPSARGVLRNRVRIEPAAGSAASAQPDEAEDTTTIVAVSDLSVSKTGPLRAVAGTPIEYAIVVRNAGPSDALGLRVLDALPAALRDVTWTCTATGSSSCAASGSTTLDLTATLKVGDELRIALQADVDPAFLGTLVNPVNVTPETGSTDPTPGDLAATATTEVVAEVDIAVSKTNSASEVIAGTTTTYAIVVGNAGPSDAPQVRVRDALPARIEDASWTCVGSGGATCPAAGEDGIDFIAAIPAGGTLAIQMLAQIDDAARGQVENVARADVQGSGATELDPTDNSASDLDTITVSTDLQLTLTDAFDPFDPDSGFVLPFEIDVYNAGPSSATRFVFEVEFSHPVGFDLPAGCSYTQALNCEVGALAAGAHHRITLGLFGLPSAPGRLDAAGLVAGPEPDPIGANNAAQQSTEMRTGADVAVSIDRTSMLIAGETARYEILVRNLGSVAVEDVEVDVPIPAELLGASWTCTPVGLGASCPPAGSGAILQPVDLAAGQGLRFVLVATVDAGLDPTVTSYIDLHAEATVSPEFDFNLGNNSAVDHGLIESNIFRDGFENRVTRRAASAGASR